MQKINFDDVLYIEGQSDYLKIVTEKERFMTLMNFKKSKKICRANILSVFTNPMLLPYQRLNL